MASRCGARFFAAGVFFGGGGRGDRRGGRRRVGPGARPGRAERSRAKDGRAEEAKTGIFLMGLAARTAPPFTLTISPVIKPARGVHKNRMGPAISSGSAGRPSGIGGEDTLAGLGIGERRGGHVGRDPAWRDAIDADAVRRELGCQAFGHANDGAFAGGVVGVEGFAALACGGADENNMGRPAGGAFGQVCCVASRAAAA